VETVNAHALVVGIAEYKYAPNLPNAVFNDAQDIHAVLQDPTICAYPHDPTRVKLLRNSEATKDAILDHLATLAKTSDAESWVFVYFSGHGGQLRWGPDAGEYLLPYGGTLNETRPWNSNISASEFVAALKAIRASAMLVILDCCHAEGITQEKNFFATTLQPGLSNELLDHVATGKGRVTFSSAEMDENSYIVKGANNSVFTEALLAGLRGEATGRDRFIHVFDLYSYVQPRVTGVVNKQHPIFAGRLRENFPIALYRGGSERPVVPDREGYRYDVYVSFTNRGNDKILARERLIPRLQEAGLQVAIGGRVERPGLYRVVGIERALEESRRIILLISAAYLRDNVEGFKAALGQELGINDGTFRVIPVYLENPERLDSPLRYRALVGLDLSGEQDFDQEVDRLIEELRQPLSRIDASH
jgi:hypothetical protein